MCLRVQRANIATRSLHLFLALSHSSPLPLYPAIITRSTNTREGFLHRLPWSLARSLCFVRQASQPSRDRVLDRQRSDEAQTNAHMYNVLSYPCDDTTARRFSRCPLPGFRSTLLRPSRPYAYLFTSGQRTHHRPRLLTERATRPNRPFPSSPPALARPPHDALPGRSHPPPRLIEQTANMVHKCAN